jgi:hypothetical protein
MPATSETDICNLALGHLGEARITSLEEDGAAARACALHYDNVREQVLRSHRWNFAQSRKVLSRVADRPVFGWKYQYEIPADCLRVAEFNDSEAGDVLTAPYIIEGRRLLTNETEARLVYIKKVTTVSQFDPLFIEAFALKLAVVLSETIRGTTGKTEQMMALYDRAVAPQARRVDANEGRRRKGLLPINSLSLRARGLGAGSLFEPDTASGGLGRPDDDEDEDEDEDDMDTWTVSLVYFGEAVLNEVFDGYKPTSSVKLKAIELSAQEPPIGSSLTIQLVDAFEVAIGDPISLPALSTFIREVVSPAQSIVADTTIRAKVTAVGSTFAASGLRVNLSLSAH